MPPGELKLRRSSRGVLVVCGYAALSLFCWHHLLSAGLGSHLHVTEFGDPGQGVWFMGWLPYALGNHLNPFVSGYMFAPQGVNLIANTSFFLESLVLSPLTVTAGPLVSFNVACVLAPIVSAGAMYYALRRLELGAGAAFLGGLAFGFTPVVLQNDVLGHFNLTWMFFPPLLVLLLERILLRQGGQALRYGLALGGLVVLQFFSSLEVLLDCVLLSVVALVIVCIARWREVPSHFAYAARALGTAVLVAVVVLAYPLFVYFAGPQHVTALNSVSHPQAALTSLVWPSQHLGHGLIESPGGTPFLRRFDQAFVGPAVLLLAVGSLAFARRRLTAGLLLGVAAVSFVLSWGPALRLTPGSTGASWHAPAWYLAKAVPTLRNVAWIRFSLLTDCLLVICAAFTLHELFQLLAARRVGAPVRGLFAAGLGALAVVPLVVAGEAPFAVFRYVDAPAVLRDIPQVDGRTPIALVFPSGGVFDGPPLAWQAMAGFTWRSWGGYAWHPTPGSGGRGTVVPDGGVVQYIVAKAPSTSPTIVLTAAHRRQIRDAFAASHIDTIVVVDGYPGALQLDRVFRQAFGPGRHTGGGTIFVLNGTKHAAG